MVFIQETRGKIRQHIGRAAFGTKYLYDTISAVGGVNTITLPKARKLEPNHLSGGSLYVLTGLASGTESYIADTEQGTGVIELSPVPLVMPSIGDTVEIWPDIVTLEQVNDAIDLALLDVQHLVMTYQLVTSPTIDSARTRITVPSDWSHVSRLTYEYGGSINRLRPQVSNDAPDQTNFFALEGSSIYVPGGIPASATNVRLLGYKGVELPDADSDIVGVRSDFVTWKAAAILLMNQMEGPQLDPAQSGAKVQLWLRAAEDIKRQMNSQVIANTVQLIEGL